MAVTRNKDNINTSLNAYTYRTATNELIDYLKKSGRRPELLFTDLAGTGSNAEGGDGLSVLDTLPASEADQPHVGVVGGVLDEQLARGLAQLTPYEKRVVALDINGYSLTEIAEKLSRSYVTVKMTKSRAYKRLKKYFGVALLLFLCLGPAAAPYRAPWRMRPLTIVFHGR